MEDFLYGIPQGLGVILIFSNYVTKVFGFHTFQEAVEMVHCGSIPNALYGRVVPLPLPFKFAVTSLCCQNLAAKINPLLTCCGVLHLCIGACLSSKFLKV